LKEYAKTKLEKRTREIKQMVQERQESLKILPDKAEGQRDPPENKTEKRQLSLSNFKTEQE
jgi:hypothetical protein